MTQAPTTQRRLLLYPSTIILIDSPLLGSVCIYVVTNNKNTPSFCVDPLEAHRSTFYGVLKINFIELVRSESAVAYIVLSFKLLAVVLYRQGKSERRKWRTEER